MQIDKSANDAFFLQELKVLNKTRSFVPKNCVNPN
jgi:hypothetical protein